LTNAAGTWIGIRDLPDYADYTHHHYWATSSGGDSYMWYGDGYSGAEDLAFCLGGGGVTPISGWAIGIGIMLIFAFTILRIKKS
jgi:hypothetical protein